MSKVIRDNIRRAEMHLPLLRERVSRSGNPEDKAMLGTLEAEMQDLITRNDELERLKQEIREKTLEANRLLGEFCKRLTAAKRWIK